MIAGGLTERIDRASPRRLHTALCAIVAAVMILLISHGNYAASGDALHYMVMAHSAAFDRDLDLANDYSDPSRIITTAAGAHAQRGRNGVLRPVHDVGLPLIAAPFFAGAYRLARLTNRLPASWRRRSRLDEFIALRQLVAVLMIAVTAALAVVFFDTRGRSPTRNRSRSCPRCSGRCRRRCSRTATCSSPKCRARCSRCWCTRS